MYRDQDPSSQASYHGLRTPNEAFSNGNQELLEWAEKWADKFWGISIIQPLFLQKTKPFYPHQKYLFGI